MSSPNDFVFERKYIDLFAGIGGFYIALPKLGFASMFVSQIKETLANLYESNFGIKPNRGITKGNYAQIFFFNLTHL